MTGHHRLSSVLNLGGAGAHNPSQPGGIRYYLQDDDGNATFVDADGGLRTQFSQQVVKDFAADHVCDGCCS